MGRKKNLPLEGEERKESAESCSSRTDFARLRREVADLHEVVQELSSLLQQLLSHRAKIPVNAGGYADWVGVKDIAYAFLGSERPGEGIEPGTIYAVTDRGTFATLSRSIRELESTLGTGFFSPHQGFLINRDRMEPLLLNELLRTQGEGYVRVRVGSEYKLIPLSRRGRERLRRLWKQKVSL